MRLARLSITERHVLLWILAGLFVTYAATILIAIFRRKAEPAVVNQPPRVRRMAPAAKDADVRYWFADIFDPSLMALPNPEGFSHRLWRNGPRAGLAPNDWNIRPTYLPVPPPDGTGTLLDLPAVSKTVELVAEKLPATDPAPAAGTTYAPVTSLSSILSIINGPLSRRALLSYTSLPAVTNDVSLRATRIRLAVGTDGVVRFANIERSCGNESVDLKALDWCRQLQFAPLVGDAGMKLDDLMWGVARVAWATVLPAPTNGAGAPLISKP
jgi:hypothetical protein